MPSIPNMGTGGADLNSLVSALNGLKSAVENTTKGPGGGGPLGVLGNIGGSWGKTALTMGASWAGNAIQQGQMNATAGRMGFYDPAGGASYAALHYDPLGPLKNIPILGGIMQQGVERSKQDMLRNAGIMGIVQDQQQSNISQLNALEEQIVSKKISLNRSYSPAQAEYQQSLIQPHILESEVSAWGTQKGKLFKRAKAFQKLKDSVRGMMGTTVGMDPDSDPANPRPYIKTYAEANEAFEGATKAYDLHLRGEGQNAEKLKKAGELRGLAAEQYKQAVYGQYTPQEQATWSSVATAPAIGDAPAEDKNITMMEITNTTLNKILNLLEGYKVK